MFSILLKQVGPRFRSMCRHSDGSWTGKFNSAKEGCTPVWSQTRARSPNELLAKIFQKLTHNHLI